MARSFKKRVVIYLSAVIFLFWTTFPYAWTLVASLTRDLDLTSRPPIPYKAGVFLLSNYEYILSYEPFVRGFTNSLVVALATTAFVMMAGALGAYAIARIRFPGRAVLFNAIVIVYMIPSLVMLIPIVVLLKIFNLLDTIPGLMFAHSILLLPLMTWFLVGIFEAVPADLDDATLVDGFSRMKALFRTTIPLARGGFFIIAVFSFILSWNELLMANVVGIVNVRTLQPTILEFVSGSRILYSQMSAAGILSSLPVVVLAILLQKQIIAGIMRGAVR